MLLQGQLAHISRSPLLARILPNDISQLLLVPILHQICLISLCRLSPTNPSSPARLSSFSFARTSSYILTLSTFRSTFRSCENLHLLPFSQCPALKNTHSTYTNTMFSSNDLHQQGEELTVFGSVPKGTFCTWAVLNSSNSIFFFASTAALAANRSSFSFSFASYP